MQFINGFCFIFFRQVHVELVGRGVPVRCSSLSVPKSRAEYDNIKTRSETVDAHTAEDTEQQHPVIGYLEEGDYNQSLGRATGLGYISLAALSSVWHRTPTPLVDNLTDLLMKHPLSTRLRAVKIKVVL